MSYLLDNYQLVQENIDLRDKLHIANEQISKLYKNFKYIVEAESPGDMYDIAKQILEKR